MRQVCLAAIFVFVLGSGMNAVGGETPQVYENLKCGMCHKPDRKAAGVSLAEIAKTYQEKEKLVKFFKGESKPLIESERWGMMRGQLSKIEELQDKDKETLADYVLSFK
jgi:cytochrome c551/c552